MADLLNPHDLAASKLELLRRRLATSGLPGLVPSIGAGSPGVLSFGQQRIWFLDRFSPGLPIYNIPAAVRIAGPVDPRLLARAFAEVCRRHEVLRSAFDDLEGTPIQRLRQDTGCTLETVDLTSSGDGMDEALRRASRFALTPFDLARGPLLRAVLFRLSDIDHLLAVVVHHIVADGASMELLIREVGTLCLDFAAGRTPTLPPLPCQYSAYAHWQRARHADGMFDQQMAYWRRALAGMPEVLELPTDFPRGAVRHQGAKIERALPAALTAPLSAMAARNRATLFTILLCAFQALVARYAATTDVVVGTPVNNRPRAEFEPLIGFFVNTLVLRTDLSGDPSFAEALVRTRRAVVEALDNQDVPFELLVQELNPARSPSHSPLFQVMFSFQPEAADRSTSSALSLEPVPIVLPLAKFDLTLYVAERNRCLTAIVEYDTGLFAPTTIERFVCHYEALLGAAVSAPDVPLSLAPLDVLDERSVLEGRVRNLAPGWTIHELVDQQAERSPHAIAVEDDAGRLSYEELTSQSNTIAESLRNQGVRAGDVVAVLLDRSRHLIVALLGALKTGAAYLPLDPHQPASRIAAMLDAAAPRVLMVERATMCAVPGVPTRVVLFDSIAPARAAVDLPATTAGDAYVIFTSGSTGRPKGVVIPHAAVVNVLQAFAEEMAADASDRLLAVTTAGFDIAALEWFLPLTTGGTLVMASWAESKDGTTLARRLIADRITVLQATPATWRLVIDGGWLGGMPLKVLCGGEALPLDLARELTSRSSTVWNVYGPTETTIWSMIWRVPAAIDAVSLGRPLANTRIAMLGRDGALVPVGVPGELCIGGAGLARGYVGLPALTAAAFVPDHLGGAPGARFYRTGDLARVRSDGRVEFLGRADRQVKIRGHRVEPGDVEAALAAIAGGADTAVIARRDPAGDVELTAFIVSTGEIPAVEDLRHRLRLTLPEYMMPMEFVFLPAIPLTASGKVDRIGLARYKRAPAEAKRRTAPENAAEDMLVAIWSDVLSRDDIGTTDNFFDLGGHSLRAARLLARIRSVYGVEIPLRDFFDAPTVQSLARAIAVRRRLEAGTPGPIAVRRPGAPAPDVLSRAQERLFFLSRLDPGFGAYQLVFAARVHARLDEALLARSLDALLERHESLRTAFVAHADGVKAIVQAHSSIRLTLTDWKDVGPQELNRRLETVAREESARPFDLAVAPLVRARLIAVEGDESVLVLTLHHLVADGWAIQRLVGELAEAYQSFASNRPWRVPPLLVQYGDYALWQRTSSQIDLGARLERRRQQIAGAATTLEIVADRSRPRGPAHRGAHLRWALPSSTIDEARRFARAHEATLFMTLLAAWEALLLRWSGTDDFLIGTPVLNRSRLELEPIVGLFANTVVVRADLRGDPSFATLLGRVRNACLDALADEGLPFEMLVDACAPERDLDRTPLFQTMFLMQHEERDRETASQSGWEPLHLETGTARFDVTLAITDAPAEVNADIEYNADIFEPETIASVAAAWHGLLTSALARPSLPTTELPFGAVRAEPAQPTRDADDPPAVLDRISRIAATSPETCAVAWEHGSWTYRDLWDAVTSFGQRLRAAGIGLEQFVPIEAHRGPDTIAAMLGAWAVGAAYVPVDPDAPRDRTRVILRTLGADECWRVDAQSRPARTTDPLPLIPPSPEAAAYVIFTSGSTGSPKGVVVSRRARDRFTDAAVDRFSVRSSDRVLQFAALTFDTSIEEIVPALAVGAALIIAPDEIRHSIDAFFTFCERQRVTVLDLPTAFWHEWVSAMHAYASGVPESVRLVIIGGEAARADRLAEWREMAPDVELVNTYGPTETTVSATACSLRAPIDPGRRVPIGRVMPGVRIYVLDRHLAPVPIGLPGEMVIAGDAVARGYLGDPALTAERFVPDPFDAGRGSRAYRTGDIGRVNGAGVLEFLGRNDRQVKIRGFRVEPAEVEAVLQGHPAVAHAVVIAHEERSRGVRLIACVIPARAGGVSAADLREYLVGELPSYLVPAAFVLAAAIPHTPTGKIDSSAIAAMADEDGGKDDGTSSDPALDLLLEIWRDALGTPVRADDNFFEVGGHSLLILRVTAAVREAFGKELPVRAIFERPTPKAIAAWLRGAEDLHRRLPPLDPQSRSEAPLTPSQEKVWAVQRGLGQSAMLTINTAVTVDAPLDPQRCADALNALAARHPILTSRIVEQPDVPTVFRQSETPLHVDFFDLSHHDDEAAHETACGLADYLRRDPIELTTEAPVRLWLVRLSPSRHALLLALHHIAGDAVSVDIFFDEFSALYNADDAVAAALPPLAATFADFAVWQRRLLANGAFDRQFAFWRATLAPPLPPIAVRAARPAETAEPSAVGRERLLITRAVLDPLLAVARGEWCTPFMAILAVLGTVVGRAARAEEVRVATMAANRGVGGTAPLIGLLANTLVLRTSLTGDASFRTLLRRVRQTVLAAFDHQELPFETLVDRLEAEAGIDRHAIVSMLFLWQHAPQPSSTGRSRWAAQPLYAGARPPGPDRLATSFDIIWECREAPQGLEVRITYKMGVDEAGDIRSLLHHFERAVVDAGATPDDRAIQQPC